ncbi:MAG TPA: PaaI family thioesterase, partial [Polyangiaceae bacterium]|nr:PaaI family thioesterase [Polyangiaceae bacterium]
MMSRVDTFRGFIDQELPERAPPFTRWLNGKIVAVDRGSVTMRWVVREEAINAAGILHGGIQSAMLDEIMGMAVATLDLPEFHITLDLHVAFLGRARLGETVTGTGTVIREGKRVVYCEGALHDGAGKLLARASSSLI